MKTAALSPLDYTTEPKQLDDILSALDAMAVEALAKISLQPGRHISIDPDHARLCALESAIADCRTAVRLAA
jgi:hypothetical protein